MLIFVAAIVLAAGLLFAQLLSAFLANPLLNGLILGILLVGIGYIFRQVLTLNKEIVWIETYRKGGDPVSAEAAAPKLLGPMVTMMGERDRRLSMSAVSMRHLLDSISSRLDEFRDLSRYLIGLLIFLGLLGTFWGLLRTIDAVSDVITGLPAGTGDLALIFANLKSGLTAPLSGMGIAFSSSLFGLAGSLVLGFL
ncbi:MAG: flagellar motor protein MotA, partial [Proteobacteria bacterium]|nr:flagellar motor protein MotA [Pseudomonadota bacterium]